MLSRPNTMPTPPHCAFPGCGEWADHPHHVTYDPEIIRPLCLAHHEQITMLNGQQARKYRTVLSNRFRWWIWYQWIDGKLKPRRTRKALEWTEAWTPRPEEYFEQEQAEPKVPVSTTPIVKRKTRGRDRANANHSGR